MLTQKDIVKGLRECGLSNGDVVLLHSALSSLGEVDGGAQAVVDAFLEVVGSQGTLVTPVFGALGIITETVKNHADAVKSIHPHANVAAIGASAEEICRDHWKADTAHGANTPYTRIADLGGYVCLLGVDQDRNTTLHTVETLLELPYLKDKTAVVETPDGPVEKTWKFFPGPHRDFIGVDKALRQSGRMRVGRIGNSIIRLIKSKDVIDICVGYGKENPAFVLCDNPNCTDCRWQRGKLMQAKSEKEAFSLVASSGLAGKYVPEMIDNLRSVGIGKIEIDYIQGLPVDRMAATALDKYASEIREAGIEITSLRSHSYGKANRHLLEKAHALNISRFVIPLHCNAEDAIREAHDRNIRISFSNNHISSQAASDILRDLKAKGLQAGLTFNPANFAECGENPFLGSYKAKLKGFIDQLDICDRTFDGIDARLACGNGEIKELMSILRCCSFAGHMVLCSSNRSVASLQETADGFWRLIDSM